MGGPLPVQPGSGSDAFLVSVDLPSREFETLAVTLSPFGEERAECFRY